ncbi:sodium:calcium antiporter [Accumulibacter sp.]|uniref:sodium:calcium antiporter n=1 Tax=Accumulibacter sp. TaxID=2053492 RepID=UPI0025FFF493|nr:sodium:calcium antiporter [Accumulibacter sp.]MCM8611949.1 sodium:calcium antiporter [Accumulibacter sp.]MCM8635571.1 sodium:calcium antiporter [Accumulibacter sp.]MCM8639149.1 sodium:calcium antiporter [Accumulibacter sp.]
MNQLGIPALLLVFAAAAVATWIAGVWLARATDVLDDRFGLGETIGGMVLLSITGALPELAITISAVTSGHLDIAAGNLIGGVAMQTLVLVIADRFVTGSRPLSTVSASLLPALEGVLVIAVVGITVMSGLLPASAAVGPIGVGSIAIFVVWLVGMLALARCRDRKDMDLVIPAEPATTTTEAAIDRAGKGNALENASTARNVVIFVAASVVTLIAGVVLEQSGDRLADLMGINGVLFGATVLAFASALPEISTAVTGVQMKSYTLVFGDIFGGNAFQLILFVLADLLAGQPVLTHEGRANAWIGMIGLVMTTVYVAGILLRHPRRYWGLGADSWAALLIYVLGTWGFVLVSG